MNEQEKKRAYNKRIIHIDHGTFTLLVFSVNGSMERKCQKFYSRLAQVISEKKNLLQSISSHWIRIKVCFVLLKSSLLCLRGSRTVCRKTAEFEIDVDVSHTVAIIYKLDDNHKTNIDTFEGVFFVNCELITGAAYNLQRIS